MIPTLFSFSQIDDNYIVFNKNILCDFVLFNYCWGRVDQPPSDSGKTKLIKGSVFIVIMAFKYGCN